MCDVKCCMCEWAGHEEELAACEDRNGVFFGCPECRTDAYLMDLPKAPSEKQEGSNETASAQCRLTA